MKIKNNQKTKNDMFFKLKVNAYQIRQEEDNTMTAGFFCDNEEWRKMLDRIKDCDLKDYLRIHRGYEIK